MKKKIYIAAMALCLIVFCVSAFKLIRYYGEAREVDSEFDRLAEFIAQADEAEAGEAQTEGDAGQEEPKEDPVLKKYQELHEQNPDMAGWIYIEGTGINYPVMYVPEKQDFYLKHNFEKEESRYGVPYVAEHCDLERPSDNLIIYGHHMKNGSMFTGLMDYRDKGFYLEHKVIHFDTLTERAEYEVLAVFMTTANEGQGFAYYEFTDAQDEKEFDEYVEASKRLSLYDTGVNAEFGDKLITLSTCEYSNENGRLVVVAKKIS